MSAPILVPLDGSAFAAQALAYARAVARRLDAPLHLVSVYQPMVITAAVPDAPVYDQRFDDEQRAALDAQLRATVEAIMPTAPGAVTHATIDADSVDLAIMTEADRVGAQLIVSTTHGRGGLQRAWLGSVADRLVVTAAVPVLLVRPREASEAGEGAGGERAPVAESPEFRRVLIALDGSALAEEVLRHVPPIAASGAEYCLLRVVPVPATRNDPEQAYWTPLERDSIEARRAEATQYLEQTARPLLPAETTVTCRVVLSASPASAILEAARDWEADLVAISTHGRSGLARLVAGSVADKVYRGSEVPTLVVRPHG